MIVIPTLDSQFTSFSINIELDSEIYNLIFNWNSRDEEWFMSILDFSEVPIIFGVKLVLDYDLFEDFEAIADLPLGIFLFVQMTDEAILTEKNFGTDFQLTYYTKEELDEAEEEEATT